MEVYSRAISIFQLGLFFSLFSLVRAQSVVEYSITEEETPTVVLGNIVDDSELRNLNSTLLQGAAYEIVQLDDNRHEYFAMDNEELLYIAQLDRDEICPMAVQCNINLDIQVQTNTDFYLVKVSITILDINDRIPIFREDSFEFSLSEASAVGMRLPLPTASDLDSPENGIVEYTVENLPQVFEFQSGGVDTTLEPAIVLLEQLDRENVDWYAFDLLASDSASLPNTGSTRISIQVLDVNDNSPEFEQTLYTVEVSESILPGDEIIRITATDVDDGDNAKILYHLNGQTIDTYGDLFSVDENTGQVLLNGELDYETIKEASLTIIARNQDASSLYSQTRVQITVLDVNDNAPFIRIISGDAGSISVSEYTSPGTVITLVKVTDEDTGGGGRFDCSLDSFSFELDKIGDTDYTIKTLTHLDRETIASYGLTITCTDSGTTPMSSESIVTVIVADENDNNPSFEHNLFIYHIPENTSPGDELFTASATDADAGDNARVSYTLADITPSFAIGAYFEINRDTGSVSSKHVLDFENATQYSFVIIATDNGNPPLSITCNVSVHILDEDDNAPVFAKQIFSIDIEERNDIGAQVTQVTANDVDSPPLNTIKYELVNNDQLESNFSIDPNTGAIFANFSLNREQEMNFSLTVMAVGPPPMFHNSTTIVDINVLDVNDNDPVILFPSDDNDTVTVSSYLRRHSIITHIIADDFDEKENAQLSYHIVSGDLEGIFELDDTSGYLSMKYDYKVTHVHTMELLILVSDNGTPKLSTSAHLYIAFNETMSEADESSLENKGKNESIAIIIGVLSGVLVVILLVAIICVFRRLNYHKQSPKATRLQSTNESVLEHDTSSGVPYGEFPVDGSFADQAVRGYDNPGMDQSEGDPPKAHVQYTVSQENNAGFTLKRQLMEVSR